MGVAAPSSKVVSVVAFPKLAPLPPTPLNRGTVVPSGPTSFASRSLSRVCARLSATFRPVMCPVPAVGPTRSDELAPPGSLSGMALGTSVEATVTADDSGWLLDGLSFSTTKR